jgi:hypothetical protein
MIILAIPTYYQVFAWLSYSHAPRYPTTTAEYIALPPSTDPSITSRNDIIVKDAVAWGWHVYNTDLTSPKMKKWWAQYEAAAKRESWDDDIWRIWQREHSVRIAEEAAKRKSGGKERENKMDAVIRGMKRIGQRTKNARHAAELQLRQMEDRKRVLRDEARDMRKCENEQLGTNTSEVSLPGSFMTRLDLWRGGLTKHKEYDPLVLSRHPWVSLR